jgi:hypothetical protein
MIGQKNLKDIRADVTAEFSEHGLDVNQWLAERIEMLQDKKKPQQRELETLWHPARRAQSPR